MATKSKLKKKKKPKKKKAAKSGLKATPVVAVEKSVDYSLADVHAESIKGMFTTTKFVSVDISSNNNLYSYWKDTPPPPPSVKDSYSLPNLPATDVSYIASDHSMFNNTPAVSKTSGGNDMADKILANVTCLACHGMLKTHSLSEHVFVCKCNAAFTEMELAPYLANPGYNSASTCLYCGGGVTAGYGQFLCTCGASYSEYPAVTYNLNWQEYLNCPECNCGMMPVENYPYVWNCEECVHTLSYAGNKYGQVPPQYTSPSGVDWGYLKKECDAAFFVQTKHYAAGLVALVHPSGDVYFTSPNGTYTSFLKNTEKSTLPLLNYWRDLALDHYKDYKLSLEDVHVSHNRTLFFQKTPLFPNGYHITSIRNGTFNSLIGWVREYGKILNNTDINGTFDSRSKLAMKEWMNEAISK